MPRKMKMKWEKSGQMRTRRRIVILCDLGWSTPLKLVVTSLQLALCVIFVCPFLHIFFPGHWVGGSVSCVCVCVDTRKTYGSYNCSTSWNTIKRINFCLHFSLLFLLLCLLQCDRRTSFFCREFWHLLSSPLPLGVCTAHIFVYSHSGYNNTFNDNNGDDNENERKKKRIK